MTETVLLLSRSLLRGTFHHHRNGNSTGDSNYSGHASTCIITHSSSAHTLADLEAECPSRSQLGSGACANHLPPIIDDCTPTDHSRRVEIAKSHGFEYDEAHGVTSILQSLTPCERTRLADDRMPLRHYRAEKGNLSEAVRKIKATLKWREEFDVEDIKRCFDAPDGRVDPETQKRRNALAGVIARENETGKIYCRGYDKHGRAILYLTPGKENSNHEYNNMRHLVYHLERAIACTRAHSGREKICIVIGYQGFRLTNAPPLSTVRHTLAILQGHYPERMHRAYVCDPPLVFRTFWGVMRHCIDAATLEKVAFCAGGEGRVLLKRDFDTATTERQAGGTDERLRAYSSREFLYETPFHHTFDERR